MWKLVLVNMETENLQIGELGIGENKNNFMATKNKRSIR